MICVLAVTNIILGTHADLNIWFFAVSVSTKNNEMSEVSLFFYFHLKGTVAPV